MPFSTSVNFGPYDAEQTDIQRKKKIAQLLQQEAFKPIGEQQGRRFAVPTSPLVGISKVLGAGLGAYQEGQAGTDQQALQQRMQSERQAALAKALQQSQGSPQPPAEQGGGPAMPPDPVGSMGTLAQSGDPAVMQMGAPFAQMAQQQLLQQQKLAQPQPQPQPQPFNLSPGQTRFGPDGKPVASLPPTPPQPPQRQPQIIQTAEGPMVVGPDGKAMPITGPAGAQVRPPARQGGPMTATAQRELIETEEQVQGGQAALQLFQQAKALNDKAMGFTGAGMLASAGSVLPSALRPGTVDATQDLDNILQSAALPQLKAIFGGMPTEGERKILLDVQGSSSKPPKVRSEIFKRAEAAIQRRIQFNAEKAKRLREGTYFTGEGLPSLQPQGGGGLSADEQRELQELRQRLGR